MWVASSAIAALALLALLIPTATACTNEMHTSAAGVTSGTLATPGANYISNADCSYTFDFVHGGIELVFNTFDLENGYDYMYIYEGTTSPSTEFLKIRVTGTEALGQTMYFEASQVVVVFQSDTSVVQTGYSIDWARKTFSASSPGPPSPLTAPDCSYTEPPSGSWPSLEIAGDATLEFNLRLDATAMAERVDVFSFRSTTTEFIIRFLGDDIFDQPGTANEAHRTIAFQATGGVGNYEAQAPAGSVSPGVDVHLAGIYDSGLGTWSILVDGVPQTTMVLKQSGSPYTLSSSSLGLHIGYYRMRWEVTDAMWDLRVWNYSRTAAEIDTNRLATLTGCETGLIGLFRLDIEHTLNEAGIGCGGLPGAGICSQPRKFPPLVYTTSPAPVTCGDGYVEGAPCTTCAHPNGMDCAGTCDGNAILDACNVCSGGTTNRLPNADRDDCGVCFGGNADRDDCGVCFGANAHKDECGVCFGSNTTCAGCDGVPNSGLVRDVCGVCDGDGSSCLGCDGVPIPSGGAHFDACGVCGGNATVCYVGCDGVYGSSIHYDCHGVCGGNATIDSCGMCAGGNVSTPLPYNYHLDSCGVCFGQDLTCTTCASGVLDACGVCDGDNSTCVGCDGIRVSDGGALFDLCGVCGGDGSSCIMGCDGVLGSSATYDCTGTCSGTAAIDECNSCTGGTSLIPTANFFRDDCGICFRGNVDRDSCGVCFGGDADRDDCGVCRGHNAAMDDCGACFGSNLAKDDCGTCYGNNTVCAGCDGIPNSGLIVDACGVCTLPAAGCNGIRAATRSSTVSPLVVSAMGGSVVVICILLIAALVIAYRRRRSASVLAYHATLADKAPQGEIFIISTDIENSTMLWEINPDQMIVVLDKHNEIMRTAITATGGYEFKTEGDAFFVAHADVEAAVACCVRAQLDLMAVAWPNWLVSVLPSGDPAVWNGVRVRMGIHYGQVSSAFDVRAGRTQYFGSMVNLATLVSDTGTGGQIVTSREVIDQLAAARSRLDLDDAHDNAAFAPAEVTVTPLANVAFDGMSASCEVWEIMPTTLANRAYDMGLDRINKIASISRPLAAETPPPLATGIPVSARTLRSEATTCELASVVRVSTASRTRVRTRARTRARKRNHSNAAASQPLAHESVHLRSASMSAAATVPSGVASRSPSAVRTVVSNSSMSRGSPSPRRSKRSHDFSPDANFDLVSSKEPSRAIPPSLAELHHRGLISPSSPELRTTAQQSASSLASPATRSRRVRRRVGTNYVRRVPTDNPYAKSLNSDSVDGNSLNASFDSSVTHSPSLGDHLSPTASPSAAAAILGVSTLTRPRSRSMSLATSTLNP
ncbi:adenylate/guanylate cyclase [Thecamonas trahens ATCC 50062]|uniref:Adenylate/guanylate cyclase n=1 Tax=Thecamonas trahens ATCC 50062 TaxID=461836 RepID=A0A0L0DCJ4_THETB|nr:adenylate/guanylate cyclase [Thecamonas trahens ATCC 50062]KNC49955.1 adenylate/guanylate cyclase [Thecamonas trahens ATCC 50062]|eukprot:XP_013757430.1 adenylate/guanylate cyclase [Thecamonas trahens ATCC 50062]